MSRNVATVLLHADVSDAAGIMAKRGVRRVPVVDEDHRPHGMVTLDDLVRHLGREADAVADTVILQVTKLSGQP
jgi:CBS domain-containing protein